MAPQPELDDELLTKIIEKATKSFVTELDKIFAKWDSRVGALEMPLNVGPDVQIPQPIFDEEPIFDGEPVFDEEAIDEDANGSTASINDLFHTTRFNSTHAASTSAFRSAPPASTPTTPPPPPPLDRHHQRDPPTPPPPPPSKSMKAKQPAAADSSDDAGVPALSDSSSHCPDGRLAIAAQRGSSRRPRSPPPRSEIQDRGGAPRGGRDPGDPDPGGPAQYLPTGRVRIHPLGRAGAQRLRHHRQPEGLRHARHLPVTPLCSPSMPSRPASKPPPRPAPPPSVDHDDKEDSVKPVTTEVVPALLAELKACETHLSGHIEGVPANCLMKCPTIFNSFTSPVAVYKNIDKDPSINHVFAASASSTIYDEPVFDEQYDAAGSWSALLQATLRSTVDMESDLNTTSTSATPNSFNSTINIFNREYVWYDTVVLWMESMVCVDWQSWPPPFASLHGSAKIRPVPCAYIIMGGQCSATWGFTWSLKQPWPPPAQLKHKHNGNVGGVCLFLLLGCLLIEGTVQQNIHSNYMASLLERSVSFGWSTIGGFCVSWQIHLRALLLGTPRQGLFLFSCHHQQVLLLYVQLQFPLIIVWWIDDLAQQKYGEAFMILRNQQMYALIDHWGDVCVLFGSMQFCRSSVVQLSEGNIKDIRSSANDLYWIWKPPWSFLILQQIYGGELWDDIDSNRMKTGPGITIWEVQQQTMDLSIGLNIAMFFSENCYFLATAAHDEVKFWGVVGQFSVFLWDPGGHANKRLGGKPHFMERGMSGPSAHGWVTTTAGPSSGATRGE